MNVILIGYRGSGKSSIGKKLANELWKDFVDLDQKILAHFDQSSIADIWKTHGESAFRETEQALCKQFCEKTDQVIALGGGTVMLPEARKAIEQSDAKRIYLKCDPEVLERRISGDASNADNRPSLTGKGGSLEEIQQVLSEREPVYEAVADGTFDVTHCTIEQAIQYLTRDYL